MENTFPASAAALRKDHRRRRRLLAVLAVLLFCAAGIVSRQLHLVDITMAAEDSSGETRIAVPDTLSGLSTRDLGIQINLLDYDQRTINRNHALQFNHKDKRPMNAWTGAGEGARAGIVEPHLAAGYPKLTHGESLAYLFDPTLVHRGKKSYANLDQLFQQDIDGYYYYDSSQNFATLTPNGENPGSGKNFTLYTRPNDLKPAASDPGARFIPLNPFDTAEPNINWYFGMTVKLDFLMPPRGQLPDHNGTMQDMVFQFLGDDDVWVFVDDRLVLDLGGIHDRAGGSVNFNTGAVSSRHNYIHHPDVNGGREVSVQQANLWSHTVFGQKFAPHSKHTLTFFYLERGAAASNCALRFNLPSVPPQSLVVAKQLERIGTDNAPNTFVTNLEYPFRVLKADATGALSPKQSFIAPGTQYRIFAGGADTGTTGTVKPDGTFLLKHNEAAVFPELLQPENHDRFVIEEIFPANVSEHYDPPLYHAADKSGTLLKGQHCGHFFIYTTPVQSGTGTGTAAGVLFRNRLKPNTLSILQLHKETAPGAGFAADSGRTFPVSVKIDGVPLPDGTPFTVDAGSEIRTSKDGIVNIKAGETLTMKTGLLIGTAFEVTEQDPIGLYQTTYTGKITNTATAEIPLVPTTEDGRQSGIGGSIDAKNSTVQVTICNDDAPAQKCAELCITKEVIGAPSPPDREFSFQITLPGAVAASSPVGYARPGSELLHPDTSIFWNAASDGTVRTAEVKLYAGESITLQGLPAGAIPIITERGTEGSSVSWAGNISAPAVGNAVTTPPLCAAEVTTVTCINTIPYELPMTGGAGSAPTLFASFLLTAGAAISLTQLFQGRKQRLPH